MPSNLRPCIAGFSIGFTVNAHDVSRAVRVVVARMAGPSQLAAEGQVDRLTEAMHLQAPTTRAKAIKALANVIKADKRLLEQGREQGMVMQAISHALKVGVHPMHCCIGGVILLQLTRLAGRKHFWAFVSASSRAHTPCDCAEHEALACMLRMCKAASSGKCCIFHIKPCIPLPHYNSLSCMMHCTPHCVKVHQGLAHD